MKHLTFPCSHCGKHMGIGLEFAGRAVRCPHCRQVLTAPTTPATADEPSALPADAPTPIPEAKLRPLPTMEPAKPQPAPVAEAPKPLFPQGSPRLTPPEAPPPVRHAFDFSSVRKKTESAESIFGDPEDSDDSVFSSRAATPILPQEPPRIPAPPPPQPEPSPEDRRAFLDEIQAKNYENKGSSIVGVPSSPAAGPSSGWLVPPGAREDVASSSNSFLTGTPRPAPVPEVAATPYMGGAAIEQPVPTVPAPPPYPASFAQQSFPPNPYGYPPPGYPGYPPNPYGYPPPAYPPGAYPPAPYPQPAPAAQQAPVKVRRKGQPIVIGFLALYAVAATAAAVWGIFLGGGAPPHPYDKIADFYGEYDRANRRKVVLLPKEFPSLDGELPNELKGELGKTVTVGKLAITPLAIEERRPKSTTKYSSASAAPSTTRLESCLALRVRIRNLSTDIDLHPVDPAFQPKVISGRSKDAQPTVCGLYYDKHVRLGGPISWPFGPGIDRVYLEGQEQDDKPLAPGAEREFIVYSSEGKTVDSVLACEGPILWKTMFRRGLESYKEREVSVSTLFGVLFRASDVKRLPKAPAENAEGAQ